MSAEKTLELLKKLKEDPKAKELLDGLKNTAPADDVITCYAQAGLCHHRGGNPRGRESGRSPEKIGNRKDRVRYKSAE